MSDLPLNYIVDTFSTFIEPRIKAKYTPSTNPVTVFLGAQPGAGKTNAQSIITGMYGFGSLMPIVGDDFRSYHPDYEMLLKTSPLEMPNKTARAAGIFDRYTVITREGVVLYDGADPIAFMKAWKSGFDRLLSETEVENARKYLSGIVSLWKTLDSSNTEAKKVLNELHSDLKRELSLRKFLTNAKKVSDLHLREK